MSAVLEKSRTVVSVPPVRADPGAPTGFGGDASHLRQNPWAHPRENSTKMYLCYVNELSDTSCLNDKNAQPAFILAGLFIDQAAIKSFTLIFQNGHALTVFDENEQYKSFSIQPGDIYV